MEKRKVRMVEGFKKRIEKLLKAFSDYENKQVHIEVEVPMSNKELASEIKKSIKALTLLSKEAKKRGLTITTTVGMMGIPTDLSKLDVRIYEYKEY